LDTAWQPYLYVVCCLEEPKTAWLALVAIYFEEIGEFYLFFPGINLNFQQDNTAEVKYETKYSSHNWSESKNKFTKEGASQTSIKRRVVGLIRK
jgi:hypothetical protein